MPSSCSKNLSSGILKIAEKILPKAVAAERMSAPFAKESFFMMCLLDVKIKDRKIAMGSCGLLN